MFVKSVSALSDVVFSVQVIVRGRKIEKSVMNRTVGCELQLPIIASTFESSISAANLVVL